MLDFLFLYLLRLTHLLVPEGSGFWAEVLDQRDGSDHFAGGMESMSCTGVSKFKAIHQTSRSQFPSLVTSVCEREHV